MYKKVKSNLLLLKPFRRICLARVKHKKLSSECIERWLLLKHIFEPSLQIYSFAISLDRNNVVHFSRMQHPCGVTRLRRLITPATTPSPTRVILKTWPDIKVPCLRFLSISFFHPSFLYDHIDFLLYSTLSSRPSLSCPLIYSPQTLFRKRAYHANRI